MCDDFNADPEAWAAAQEADGWTVVRDPQGNVMGRYKEMTLFDD